MLEQQATLTHFKTKVIYSLVYKLNALLYLRAMLSPPRLPASWVAFNAGA
jgi:hypothetical protein